MSVKSFRAYSSRELANSRRVDFYVVSIFVRSFKENIFSIKAQI